MKGGARLKFNGRIAFGPRIAILGLLLACSGAWDMGAASAETPLQPVQPPRETPRSVSPATRSVEPSPGGRPQFPVIDAKPWGEGPSWDQASYWPDKLSDMGFDQAQQALRGARATAPGAITSGEARRWRKIAQEQLKKLGGIVDAVGKVLGHVGDVIDTGTILKGFHEGGLVGAATEYGKKVLGDQAALAGAELGAFIGTPAGPPGQVVGGLMGGLAASMGADKIVEQWEKEAEEARAREDRWRATKEGIAADLQREMAERERIKREKEQEDARRKKEDLKKQRKQDSDQSAFVKALKSCDFEGARTLIGAQESGDFKGSLEGLYAERQAHEEITKAMAARASELNQRCQFDEALAKLGAASKQTKCDKYRDSLARKVSAVQKDQQHEKTTEALLAQANQLNQSCRFDEAAAKLEAAQKNTICDHRRRNLMEKMAMVKADSEREQMTEGLLHDANSLNKSCRFEEALAKLEAAKNNTICDHRRENLMEKMAMVNQTRQNMEKTRGLLGQAQGLYQQGDLNGSLGVLQRASQQAECDEQHATIDNAIAAIQSRSKGQEGQDVAGMLCEDDRRQPVRDRRNLELVRNADGRIACVCKDGLSEVQDFCLTPQEVAQVQPTTNPDEWIEVISTIGTIIGIIAGASTGRPPSAGIPSSTFSQPRAPTGGGSASSALAAQCVELMRQSQQAIRNQDNNLVAALINRSNQIGCQNLRAAPLGTVPGSRGCPPGTVRKQIPFTGDSYCERVKR